MARKRASMREGPLAELFRATEAAQRAKKGDPTSSRRQSRLPSSRRRSRSASRGRARGDRRARVRVRRA